MKIYTTLGYIFIVKMFHQEASVETIKLKQIYVEAQSKCVSNYYKIKSLIL